MKQVYGAVIVVDGRLLVSKDRKDPFYKIPGGTHERGETGEETCRRELVEETGFSLGKIFRMSPSLRIPSRGVELHHYFAELTNNPKTFRRFKYEGHSVAWLRISDIRSGKYSIAPNIRMLLEGGDIK